MESPLRLVCGECLRSVEYEGDDSSSPPALCPYCGGTIDSRLSEMETPTSDYIRPLPPDLHNGDSARWSETWSKGSLGTVGRFQLRELLGDGGFGQVYQAYDPRLDRDVALKVLKQGNPGERVMQRFFREARAAARLTHPNIVSVYDAGRDSGRCWIAYEYVGGKTLSRLRDHQRIEIEAAVRITRDLADALDHAHRQGVFHRDLKPANVIVDERGRPRLTDFGLARRADLDSDLTCDGAVLGTPAYMSPEQASGRSHLADERSDVYSLGVMFFELLCGRRPADLPSNAPLWRAPPISPPPAPRSIDRAIPAALDRICFKTLAPNPNERYTDARALADDLDKWLIHQRGPSGLAHALTLVASGIAIALTVMVVLKLALAPTPASAELRSPTPLVVQTAPEEPVPSKPTAEPSAHVVAKPVVSAEPIKSQASVPPDEVLVGNRDRSVYHRSTCPSVKSMSSKNRVVLASAAEANREGFRPCDKCHPPSIVGQTH